MKRIGTYILAAFTLAAFSLAAATIDGKWAGEGKTHTKKKGDVTLSGTFDFKTEGDKLTGTVTMGKSKRAAPAEIQEGKIQGDQVSFVTKLTSRNGERTVSWSGTVKGDEIELRQGKGKKSRLTMTLKRASAQ